MLAGRDRHAGKWFINSNLERARAKWNVKLKHMLHSECANLSSLSELYRALCLSLAPSLHTPPQGCFCLLSQGWKLRSNSRRIFSKGICFCSFYFHFTLSEHTVELKLFGIITHFFTSDQKLLKSTELDYRTHPVVITLTYQMRSFPVVGVNSVMTSSTVELLGSSKQNQLQGD